MPISGVTPLSTEGPRIAIVDDDESVRRALSRLLRADGFEPEAFASAREFLAAGKAFACLVLDIHLGGMSGLDLGEHLKASGGREPVIFITAHDDAASRERAARIGVVAYLRKPVDAEALLRAIGEARSRPVPFGTGGEGAPPPDDPPPAP